MDLESRVARNLREVLAPVASGAAIPASEGFAELQPSLERFLPHLLGWRGESLDGFRFCVARKVGPDEAAFIGLALLISDQTWTPVILRIRLSPNAEATAAIDCKLGERGEGGNGLVRMPYDSNKLTKVLSSLERRVLDIEWAYEVRVGDWGDVGGHGDPSSLESRR